MMDKYVSANKIKAKIISGEPVLFSEATQHEIFFLLELEPSEDVEPVKHAHVVWTEPNISYQTQCCSNCHRTFISRPDETIQFCPHCGAKMDEKDGRGGKEC